jgi:hypothetical protein
VSGHVRHWNDAEDSLKFTQLVVSGHVRALKWFETSALIAVVVSGHVNVLEWCGASTEVYEHYSV